MEIHINSIGTPEEREKYKAELVNYYRSKRSYLCEECRKRLGRNPLRLLDCKEEQCQPVKDEAPQIIDWLGDASKAHFMKVLEYLDDLGVPYLMRPTLVRGLDYYTHTVFEIYPTSGEGGAQSALGGGGRYDLLAEEMGGRPTPAVGMAIGLDRTVLYWKQYQEQNKTAPPGDNYDIFFCQLGERARSKSLRIISDLQHSGIKFAYNLYKNSLILGQKEVQEGTVIIRDMDSGNQEIVDQKKLESMIKKKLEKI